MTAGPLSQDYLSTLVGYHDWSGRRLLDAASALSAEQLGAASPSQGTIFKTLVHILDASYSWRMVAEGIDDTRWVWEVEPMDDFASMRQFWEAENRRLAEFVGSLHGDGLDREVRKPNWTDQPFRTWQVVVHIVNHQVEHANELGWRLTELGHSPGGMGFIAYIDRERREA